jgi:Protein of unknown function (DUF2442)
MQPLGDPDYFARVTVDPEAGTISWPNGVELAPEPLYAEARRSLAHASFQYIPDSDTRLRSLGAVSVRRSGT